MTSSESIANEFGPAILEALHAEHMAYMDGALLYEAERGAMVHAADTAVDSED